MSVDVVQHKLTMLQLSTVHLKTLQVASGTKLQRYNSTRYTSTLLQVADYHPGVLKGLATVDVEQHTLTTLQLSGVHLKL